MSREPIENPDQVHTYRYRLEDRSVLSPPFDRLVSKRALALVPRHLSGNLLTVVGNCGSWLSFLFLAGLFCSMPETVERVPLLLMLPAAGIFFYHTLDNIDGAQARRNGSSGPLGEFFDHWLDSLNSVTIPLGAMAVYRVSGPIIALVTALGLVAFWLSTWEQNRTGVLRLRPVSVMEGVLLAVGVHVCAALFGVAVLESEFLGTTLVTLLVAALVLAYVVTSVVAWRRVEPRGDQRWTEPAGLLMSLGLLLSWSARAELDNDVAHIAPDTLVALLIGLVGAAHVGDLHRQRLIGARYRAWNPGFVLLGLGLNLSLLVRPDPAIQRSLLLCFYAYVLVILGYQMIHSVGYMVRRLKVGTLRLTPAQRAWLESSTTSASQPESRRP